MIDIGAGITSLAWVITIGVIWIVGAYWLAQFTGWVGDCMGRGICWFLGLFNH